MRLHGQTVGPQSVAFLFAYAGLINVCVQALFLERIIKWFSEWLLLIVGFVMMAAGYAGPSICHTALITLAFLTLNNIGGAVLRPIITSQISRRVSPQRQGLAMGVNQSATAATAMAAPLVSGAFMEKGYYMGWALSSALVASSASLGR